MTPNIPCRFGGNPCGNFNAGKPFREDMCRPCWLYTHDERYNKAYGGDGTVVPVTDGSNQCIHLGQATGVTVDCGKCKGHVQLKLFECRVYGQCTIAKAVDGVACCAGDKGVPCPKKDMKAFPKIRKLRWAYGVTTVRDRRKSYLPTTLASLKAAGFDKPRLFVDGDSDTDSWRREFELEVTCRYPYIKTHGNWFLTLHELYIRNPDAERFAVFQDDFVTYKNLRSYLDWCQYPERGYLNLYTFPSNQRIAPKNERGGTIEGWYQSNQWGKGAVALVFDRNAALDLMLARHMVERPMDCHRGTRAVDGGIVSSMEKAGRKEYVHTPSLVQHIGLTSSMANNPHFQAESFLGESFDALDLIAMVKSNAS